MTTTERSWADVDPLWPPDGPLTPAISPQALAGLAAQAFDAPAPVDTIVPGVTGVPGGLPQAVPVAPRGGGGPIGVGSAPAPYAVHDGFDPAHLPDVRTAYDTPLFDVATLRRDFPILAEQVHGRPLIWLDNAATTQKPRAVIDRLTWFYEHENSNIHRAAHELAARATEAYEDARETVRRFVGAPRERGDRRSCAAPPRRSTCGARVGHTQPARGRRDRHHPPGAPRQHRAVADDLPGAPAQRCRSHRWTTRATCSWTGSPSCSALAPSSLR